MNNCDRIATCRTRRRCIAVVLCAILAALSSAAECSAATTDPVEELRAGQAALDDGFSALAEKKFASYLSLVRKGSPEADGAIILLARAYHGQKKYQDAITLLIPVHSGTAAYWRALSYYGLGQLGKVAEELSDFDNRYQDDSISVRTQKLLADSYLDSGKTNEALQVFAMLEKKHSVSPEACDSLLAWARTLLAAGQPIKAREVLLTLFARSPDTAAGQQGRLLLGRILSAGGETKEAETILNALATQKEAPAAIRSAALLSIAEIRAGQDMLEDATNVLSAGIELAPDPQLKRRGGIMLGRLLLRMKNLEEAVAVLKPYVAAVPADPVAPALQLEIAGAFLDTGNASRAAEEYQHYIETFMDRPGRAAAFSGKGWSLLLLAKPSYDEAATAFRQAYELSADPAEKARCLTKAADAHFANKQYGLATSAYQQLLTEFPDSTLATQARFQVAESAARAGKPDDAENLFKSVIATNPAGPFAEQALMRIAELKEDSGELPAALTSYEQLMASHTNSPLFASAMLAHGLINYRMLRFETALDDFETLVLRFPQTESSERAFYMRGWCHHLLGREEQALATCREFISAFPASKWTPGVLFWLGEYAFNHGNYKEAQAQFANLAAKYPDDPIAPGALLFAGEAAARQKEYLQAIEQFAALAKKYPADPRVPKARYEQGDAMTELGEFANAILVFEEIIKKYPDSNLVDMALCRKADCEFALGSDDPKRYESAMVGYKVVAGSATAMPDLRMQARYKTGTCLRKIGRNDDAFEQYYTRVMIPYLDDSRGDRREDPACQIWFTRAAFDAVEILEPQKKWREIVRILKRVVEAGVPASDEAQKRIDQIRLRHWVLP